ncbi:hypothetical protein Skr01_04590 [Sphaerisporangium krabiense]|uniref:Uncharacterized protein n=1 Tax=Sphaerisporangium krabiense TaxID=763782 RepID=A0A7W8Z788_9ACTN|nr:hypothetical protein [Sphaerisporangium krabiense]MBB5628784.1 hypothetical protein [Sphaerisporangium krabiense]GII60374.1 hypothetical protein Skr01_04590 [Sphaerisporangium krabiense]
MAFSVARTRDEAHLYLDLHPCGSCGSVDTEWDDGLVSVDGETACHYAGTCAGCGTEREFLFGLPQRETASSRFPSFGGPEPSELLDPGEWLWVADLTAGNVPADDPRAARQALTIAMAAVEEVVKFIPPGREEVPEEAFWSLTGRRVRGREPGRFRLDRLLVVRDTYRALAAREEERLS